MSFRIQRLERDLGAKLFRRTGTGMELTAAGRRFEPHAATLARTVELARQEVGVAPGFTSTLRVGCRMGLWEGLLLRWLTEYRARAPEVGVRASIGFEDDLMAGLIEGRLDLAVMYTPQARPGLRIEHLLDEELVLVSTDPACACDAAGPGADYIYVDWGPEFFARHALAFPAFTGAAVTVNMGWLGLEHLLGRGGSGYFPQRLVRSHERAGRLHQVAGAPRFGLPAWLCLSSEATGAHHRLARSSLLELAARAGDIESFDPVDEN